MKVRSALSSVTQIDALAIGIPVPSSTTAPLIIADQAAEEPVSDKTNRTARPTLPVVLMLDSFFLIFLFSYFLILKQLDYAENYVKSLRKIAMIKAIAINYVKQNYGLFTNYTRRPGAMGSNFCSLALMDAMVA
jgi:hypothetical protein